MKLAPDCIDAYSHKGLALAGIAALRVKFSHIKSALRNYDKAVVAYDQALSRAPRDVDAHQNKATALLNLARLQAALLDRDTATGNLNLALKEVTKSLELAANSKEAIALKNEIMTALLKSIFRAEYTELLNS